MDVNRIISGNPVYCLFSQNCPSLEAFCTYSSHTCLDDIKHLQLLQIFDTTIFLETLDQVNTSIYAIDSVSLSCPFLPRGH
jgi:hypothetical protein